MINKKRLRLVAIGVGLAFLATVVMRIFQPFWLTFSKFVDLDQFEGKQKNQYWSNYENRNRDPVNLSIQVLKTFRAERLVACIQMRQPLAEQHCDHKQAQKFE